MQSCLKVRGALHIAADFIERKCAYSDTLSCFMQTDKFLEVFGFVAICFCKNAYICQQIPDNIKKATYIILFALISIGAVAQENKDSVKTYQCMVFGIEVENEEFRQGMRIYFPPRGYLDVCHKDGQPVLFPKSNLGLSTYMEERGWKFVKYESSSGEKYVPMIQNRLVVMEKNASSEEEALKGLFFKQDFRESKSKN